MNNLVIIAAIGKNNELGKNNNLIWYLKEDLKFFKNQTTGKPIVMGINTFNSLPKVLPNRHHMVLTSRDIILPEGIEIFHDKLSLMEALKQYDDVFIIGGASIYKQFIDEADRLLLTEIDAIDKEADVYFPYFNKEDFNKKIIDECEENNIKYKHLEYTRRRYER